MCAGAGVRPRWSSSGRWETSAEWGESPPTVVVVAGTSSCYLGPVSRTRRVLVRPTVTGKRLAKGGTHLKREAGRKMMIGEKISRILKEK